MRYSVLCYCCLRKSLYIFSIEDMKSEQYSYNEANVNKWTRPCTVRAAARGSQQQQQSVCSISINQKLWLWYYEYLYVRILENLTVFNGQVIE